MINITEKRICINCNQTTAHFNSPEENKPLFGAIVKPKTGITPEVLLEMVKELVEGGVNFIKEDEIFKQSSIFLPHPKTKNISFDKNSNVFYGT